MTRKYKVNDRTGAGGKGRYACAVVASELCVESSELTVGFVE